MNLHILNRQLEQINKEVFFPRKLDCEKVEVIDENIVVTELDDYTEVVVRYTVKVPKNTNLN